MVGRKQGKKTGRAEEGSALGECHSEPGGPTGGTRSAAWGEGNLLSLAALRCGGQDTTPSLPCVGTPNPPTGGGKAEPRSPAPGVVYLRERLERLQPELLPPPALCPEWDEAPSRLLLAPLPLSRAGPCSSAAPGSWCRGGAASPPPPPPPPPPSASQRLALEAAIFAQAVSDGVPIRLRRPRPGRHETQSADFASSAFCPAVLSLSPPFPEILRSAGPPRQQLHMRRMARPAVGSLERAAPEGSRPSARAERGTPIGVCARAQGGPRPSGVFSVGHAPRTLAPGPAGGCCAAGVLRSLSPEVML